MDRQFTNKEELEYPTEDDFVDVKVLNNNTKILSEKKANIDSLTDVARESEPRAIENAVKSIKNDVSQNLQGVAKERSTYSIEDKVKELDRKVQYLEEREKGRCWPELPNKKFSYIQKNFSGTTKEYTFLEVNGNGNLIFAIANIVVANGVGKVEFKISIDDNTIFHTEIDFTNYTGRTVYLGILNNDFITSYDGNSRYLGFFYYKNTISKFDTVGFDVTKLTEMTNFIELSNNKVVVSAINFIKQNASVATNITKKLIPFKNKLKVTVKEINQNTSNSINFYAGYNIN